MAVFFNDKDKSLCCGCRGCEQICPTCSVKMKQDGEGFLYPSIDESTCIKCGMCEKVCPIKDSGYINPDSFESPKAYAAYHKVEDIVNNSTSGGAFSAIIEGYCDENSVVFGASFDENHVVRHTFVMNKSDITRFRNSKYVQSDLGKSYQLVKAFLIEHKKVVFSGTPCQVAGLKAYLQRDYKELLCVDVVCHGVPSPLIFENFKQYMIQKYKSNISGIEFRDKRKRGWEQPHMTITFENGQKAQTMHTDNAFIVGFYKSLYVRPVCHECPFAKLPRVSDFTIADFWGVEELKPSFHNKKGTSLLLINTAKGEEIFEGTRYNLIYESTNFKDALRYNPQLQHPTEFSPIRKQFINDFQNFRDFDFLIKKYLKGRPFIKRVIANNVNKNTKRFLKAFLIRK